MTVHVTGGSVRGEVAKVTGDGVHESCNIVWRVLVMLVASGNRELEARTIVGEVLSGWMSR